MFLEAESNRYEFFADVIRESPPDLVIVSLDGDKLKSQSLVAQIAHDLSLKGAMVIDVPAVPIIAIFAGLVGEGKSVRT